MNAVGLILPSLALDAVVTDDPLLIGVDAVGELRGGLRGAVGRIVGDAPFWQMIRAFTPSTAAMIGIG